MFSFCCRTFTTSTVGAAVLLLSVDLPGVFAPDPQDAQSRPPMIKPGKKRRFNLLMGLPLSDCGMSSLSFGVDSRMGALRVVRIERGRLCAGISLHDRKHGGKDDQRGDSGSQQSANHCSPEWRRLFRAAANGQ